MASDGEFSLTRALNSTSACDSESSLLLPPPLAQPLLDVLPVLRRGFNLAFGSMWLVMLPPNRAECKEPVSKRRKRPVSLASFDLGNQLACCRLHQRLSFTFLL
jgi:hypothetical protein